MLKEITEGWVVASRSMTWNSAASGVAECGSHFTHSNSLGAWAASMPTSSGPWKNASWATIERATSAARGPTIVITGNALSATTIGISWIGFTAATVLRRLTAHTGSRSSGEPGSSTSIGVCSATAPTPMRTCSAYGEAAYCSQTRSAGTAVSRAFGAG